MYDSLLTEILSMHKWDYNHRRSWLLWSFIQYTPLLQATSWPFFQASPDISFLTNDMLVGGIDRLLSAVFSVFGRLICERTIAFGVSALFKSVVCSARASYWLFSFPRSPIELWWREMQFYTLLGHCSAAGRGEKDGFSAQLPFHLNEQNCFTSPTGITIIKNLYCHSFCIIMNRNGFCTLNLCC